MCFVIKSSVIFPCIQCTACETKQLSSSQCKLLAGGKWASARTCFITILLAGSWDLQQCWLIMMSVRSWSWAFLYMFEVTRMAKQMLIQWVTAMPVFIIEFHSTVLHKRGWGNHYWECFWVVHINKDLFNNLCYYEKISASPIRRWVYLRYYI